MLHVESTLGLLPARAGLSRSTGEFPLPVLVWVEAPTGEWDQMTLLGPREALHAMNNGLGSPTSADWHFVVSRLAAAVCDPTPDTLEAARHALALHAAKLGVLAG
jgi:hypothetical protein